MFHSRRASPSRFDSFEMAFKPNLHVGTHGHIAAAAAAAAAAHAERPAKKARHSCAAASLDVPASRRRRVQPPRAPVVDPREAATIAYIEAHANRKDNRLLISSERPHVRIRADASRPLTVPLSQDGPARQISGVVLDAAVELLRRRQGAAPLRRNDRRVLLLGVEEQDWLEYLSSLPRTTANQQHRTAEQDAADISATAGEYLTHDMVFLPVNHREHFFVAVLNFGKGEYQVLDSENHGTYYGDRFYELALSKIRDGVGRCMEEVGRGDVAGWDLRRVAGLPEQTDRSSCGLFALKCMELWDGEKLMQSFSMDDVHALRTKLAKELVFWELNEMCDVKEEIESMMK